jgi:hypothetical protein
MSKSIFLFWMVDLQSICANTYWKRYSLQMLIFVNICPTWSIVELKTRFGAWITRNDVNGVSSINLPYLVTLTACLFSQRTPNVHIKYFRFDWSVDRHFVLNTARKRDSLQMMIFVNVCSTWIMAGLKTRFETWITRNDVNGVYVLLPLFNNAYGLPALTMDTICPNHVFYVWMVDLQTTCAK